MSDPFNRLLVFGAVSWLFFFALGFTAGRVL